LPFDFENLGEQQVKGFEEPVRVYAVKLKPDVNSAAEKSDGGTQQTRVRIPERRLLVV
jgi:class 3 adenylate cyclase